MKRIATLLAASALVLGAGLAYAQAPGGPAPADGQRFERHAERMSERFDKRLGKLKTDLKLTPQQEQLFAPVEAHIRKNMAEMRGMRGRRAEMRNAELPDRLDMMSERAAKMSTNMRELSGLVKPLWATLDDSQKTTVQKMLPGRGGMRGEGRERGHRGHDRG